MIRVVNIGKRFDEFEAVKSVSFEVSKGDTLALIGTSGSGKTTLLKMLNGLIRRSEGDIFIDGRSIDISDPVALRRNMGYVIQDVGLFPHYTVSRNIGVMWELKGEKPNTDRILSLLDLVGVPRAMAKAYPDQLSGGQKQRIGIARALALDPDILLMDEPFGALDPITRQDIQREFAQLPGIAEKAVVLVTHDLNEAALLGTTICLMDKGMVQQSGSIRDLLFRPKNQFVADFLNRHRTTLEWRAIILEDVLPYLLEQGNGNEMYPDTALADIIDGKLSGCIKRGADSLKVDPDIILRCYYDNRLEITNMLTNG